MTVKKERQIDESIGIIKPFYSTETLYKDCCEATAKKNIQIKRSLGSFLFFYIIQFMDSNFIKEFYNAFSREPVVD